VNPAIYASFALSVILFGCEQKRQVTVTNQQADKKRYLIIVLLKQKMNGLWKCMEILNILIADTMRHRSDNVSGISRRNNVLLTSRI